MKRAAGILLPLTSLPSPYGIGTMGKEAYKFIDFLTNSKQAYWQILPISPTGYGDSPYQSFSAFAGNPYWIDLDLLNKEGYLHPSEYRSIDWGSGNINYGLLYEKRFTVLKKAVKRMLEKEANEFNDFCNKHSYWLEDYSLFMVIKNIYEDKQWSLWPEELRLHKQEELETIKLNYVEELNFYKGVQYLFFKQWFNLKEYANGKGVEIIGDAPIYVALDSCDVWANPCLFDLDENLTPKEVAGCPPDGFNEDGQLWGNPLYKWDVMKEDDYTWWRKRLVHLQEVYDVIRLDHFRGFEAYYAIPYGDSNAKRGRWIKGPACDLFESLFRDVDKEKLIAEDLGFLTEEVYEMIDRLGVPGMRVLEFGFYDGYSGDYLPHNFIKNCIAYIGTHDNDTFRGWFFNEGKHIKKRVINYLRLKDKSIDQYSFEACIALWASCANLVIIQMQDLLNLGSESRINYPATLGNNWCWRMDKSVDSKLAKKLSKYMEVYDREGTWQH